MKKAYFINGGMGRCFCALPALQRAYENGEDFIIVCDRKEDVFLGTPLYDRTYMTAHANLFKEHLLDAEIVELEPYHLNSYYNQKCSLIEAFDILINGDSKGNRKIPISLSFTEQARGTSVVKEIRAKTGKKVVVIQPFGQGIQQEGNTLLDSSGRSISLKNLISLVKKLKKNYVCVYMGQAPLNLNDESIDDIGIAVLENIDIRLWMGIISAADGFIGCDSVGQHLAYGLGKPSVVITGGTFPINTTYPNTKDVKVIDIGDGKRQYSSIRIGDTRSADRNNESLTIMNPQQEDLVVKALNLLTASVVVPPIPKEITKADTTTSCCPPKEPKSFKKKKGFDLKDISAKG